MDSAGNAKTTTADKAGSFNLDVQTGTAYGVVFMDAKTLKVIGSLVQAANTGAASALRMTSSADLGQVVVNPATGKAVSINDANGTLSGVEVTNSPLDTNGDGIVTQDEMNAAQAAAAAAGGSLSTVSVVDFFAKPGTWAANTSSWSDSWGSGTDYSLSVADTKRLNGANGVPVDAVKTSELTYYKVSTDPYAVTTQGYYDNTGSTWYQSPSYTAPPATFDMWAGPMTWAIAEYPDVTSGYMQQKFGITDPYATWQQAVPLSITLGKTESNTATGFYGTNNNSFVVNIAQEGGQPYVFTDAAGVKHLVMKVDSNWSWTPDPTNCPGCMADSGQESFYVISGYGVANIPATDAAGAALTPSAAIANVPFGTISTGAAGVVITDANAVATPKLTIAQRDQMLTYLWNGRDVAGEFSFAGGTPPTDYFFPNYDANGNATTPIPWDPVTYAPLPLTGGTAQQFTTSVNYVSPAGATFTYEFRTYDTNWNALVVTSSTTPISAPVATTETTLSVAGSVNVPTLASLPASLTYSYIDANGVTVTEGWVDLYLVMKNASGIQVSESYVGNYTIH